MDSIQTPETDEPISPAQSRRSFRCLVGPAISVAALILFIGVIELVAYIWEQKTAQGPLGWTLVASRRMPVVQYGSPDQPYYFLRPSQEYNWEGVVVRTNSRGMRGDEITVPKPEDTFRILNIGDSVAFGWEVPVEDTYGQQLAFMLNQRKDGINYEVINAAAPGWNLKTARNFLLQEGFSYQPDLIILGLAVVNDVTNAGPMSGAKSGRTPFFRWLRDHTYTWPFLTTQSRFLLSKKQGPEAIPELNPGTTPDFYYPLDENDELWDGLWHTIEEIKQAAKNQGKDLIIPVFPTAMQINSLGHPDVPQRVFEARATETEIKLIDMLPVYKQVCQEVDFSECEGYENMLFADVWMHPTKLGHKLAAEKIFELFE